MYHVFWITEGQPANWVSKHDTYIEAERAADALFLTIPLELSTTTTFTTYIP